MEIRNVSSTPVNRPTASANPEAVVDTADSAESASASATAGTKSTGAGGYISPFLRYDQGARVAVLLFRDVDTGETQDQIPSQRVVEEYRRAAGRTPASSQKGASATRDPGQATGDAGGSVANTDRAAGGVVPVERGISFASFGSSSSTAAAAASFGSDSGAPAPPVPAAPIGGGSFGSAPGGLVSVTV